MGEDIFRLNEEFLDDDVEIRMIDNTHVLSQVRSQKKDQQDQTTFFRELENDTQNYELDNFKIGSFNYYDNYWMSKAYDFSTENVTFEMLRVHLCRIVLTLMVSFSMKFVVLQEILLEIKEYHHQFYSFLKWDAKHKSGKDRAETIPSIVLANISYIYFLIKCFPFALYKVFYQRFMSYSPRGLEDFQESIPLFEALSLPRSIALISRVNDFNLPSPPQIPRSYLDSDKKIRLPKESDVQRAYSLRNEYFIQYRTHIAAEKVKILGEFSHFVLWSSMVPTLNTISIYERYGYLWDQSLSTVEEKLEVLANSILNEVELFSKKCSEKEVETLRLILPLITLVDMATKKELIINNELVENLQGPNAECSFIDSLQEKRTMKVLLCDSRTSNVNIVSSNENALDDSLMLLPPTSDLIIVLQNKSEYVTNLHGYVSFSSAQDTSEPLIFSKNSNFCFRVFAKSLFKYVWESQTDEKLFTSRVKVGHQSEG